MKERPILFSGAMVRVILEGRKTQTRRMINPPPTMEPQGDWADGPDDPWLRQPANLIPIIRSRDKFGGRQPLELNLHQCPYGEKGDRLYVREAYYQFGHWEKVTGVKERTRTGRQRWKFVPDGDDASLITFDTPETYRKGRHHLDLETPAWHKRLGRFMPRRYSRITVEIVSIRAERLHAISGADAEAEGVEFDPAKWGRDYPWNNTSNPVTGFQRLWISINGAESWDSNPWVWVVSFRRVEK